MTDPADDHPDSVRHVHIESGCLIIDYKAAAKHAEDFAAALSTGLPGVVVTVDDDVRGDLRSLPCAELWQ
jgi:hypothetical protein